MIEMLMIVVILFLVMSTWALWHLWRWSIFPNPSSFNVLQKVQELLQSVNPTKKGRLIDCGSGLGVSLYFWKKQGYGDVIGFEGSCLISFLAKLWLFMCGMVPSMVQRGDWLNRWRPQSGDTLFFYVSPRVMRQAGEFFKNYEGSLDVWIISHTFALPNYFPVKTTLSYGLYTTPIYLYHIVKDDTRLLPK